MEKSVQSLLPPPNFNKGAGTPKFHYLTPCGMTLLPREKQPPPMYGPRGSTVPAKFLQQKQHQYQQRHTQNRAAPRSNYEPSESQYCSACEMECATQADFRLHRAQHQRCRVDGCNFRGHPSVMEKHVAALHTSGLYDKFKKLSTPEEIAAWREERRKRYPTLANVQQRQRAQKQRQERGERLEEKRSRFGTQEDRKRATNNKQREYENRKRSSRKGQRFNNRYKNRDDPEKQMETNKKTLEENTKITDNTEEQKRADELNFTKETPAKKETEEPKVVNALTSLLSAYCSTDDENSCMEEDQDDIKASLAIKNQKFLEKNDPTINLHDNDSTISLHDSEQNKVFSTQSVESSEGIACEAIENNEEQLANSPTQNKELSTCEVPLQDNPREDTSDEAPEEAPIAHSSDLPLSMSAEVINEPPNKRKRTEPTKKAKFVRRRGLDYRKLRLRKQNTMLEKLLEPDIRHERNVLLQCVRFVCENNFFDSSFVKKEN